MDLVDDPSEDSKERWSCSMIMREGIQSATSAASPDIMHEETSGVTEASYARSYLLAVMLARSYLLAIILAIIPRPVVLEKRLED